MRQSISKIRSVRHCDGISEFRRVVNHSEATGNDLPNLVTDASCDAPVN
ncbi:hypothetical protein [Thalassoglobus neptunius]|nr:hypothetical protein [Thalassoglobus neptunius]